MLKAFNVKILYLLISFCVLYNSLFCEEYYIDKYNIVIKINENGLISINEKIDVVFNIESHGIVRNLPSYYTIDISNFNKSLYSNKNDIRLIYSDINVLNYDFNTYKSNNDQIIKIGNPNKKVIGKQTYIINYTVKGGIISWKDFHEFYWNIIGAEWGCKMKKVVFEIFYPESIAIDPELIDIYYGNLYSRNTYKTFKLNGNYLKAEIFDLLPYNAVTISQVFNIDDFPVEKLSSNFYLQESHSTSAYYKIILKEDGIIEVNSLFNISVNNFKNIVLQRNNGYNKSLDINYIIHEYFYEKEFKYPNINYLKDTYFPLYFDETIEGNLNYNVNKYPLFNSYYFNNLMPGQQVKIQYNYKVFGGSIINNDSLYINLSLFPKLNIPILNSNYELIIPFYDTSLKASVVFYANDRNLKTYYSEVIDFKFYKNVYSLSLNFIDNEYNKAVVVSLPTNSVSYNSLLYFKLLYINNKWLLLPIVLLTFLFILWLYFGRNKKMPIYLRDYPPENMTPAEAGYLVDYKIHKRDIISLIFYWAAKGYVFINDDGNNIILKKIRNLPLNSKKFEHSFFNSLFSKAKELRIGSPKPDYYNGYRKAFKELEQEANKQNYFIVASKKVGKYLLYISYPLFIISIFFLFSTYNKYDNMQIAVSLFISSILLHFFGKIMPKKDKRIMEKYWHLEGFKEFIKIVEIDRLKLIVKKDSLYFDKTLPYAIALGLGSEWAKKFDSIVIKNPSWYKGDVFKSPNHLIRRMHYFVYRLERTFSTLPSNSTVTSGKSYSFNNSTGRSFSSSVGGRGYSGGGIGGGGGARW